MALKKRGLETYRRGIQDAVDRGVFRAAGFVEQLATELAPEDSGALKASGRVEPESPSGDAVYQVIFGGSAVDYAQYVEHGTDNPNYPAQPYLGPALDAIDVKAEIAKELQALARKSTP